SAQPGGSVFSANPGSVLRANQHIVLGAVITLVVDIDRSSGNGLVTVNQQPLIDLQEQIGAFVPAKPHE
ncbi:MAG: hypothetical protein O2805_10650, partial [Proteobacteria bacterium]|nr:hypothetical protein [Pseudomonadota bacterium]